MFRRAFWFTTGAATGIWVTAKVQRTLRGLSPDSLAGRATGRAVATGQRLRGFALDVRGGMAEREDQLNQALGLTLPPPRPPARSPAAALPTTTPPPPEGNPGNEDH